MGTDYYQNLALCSWSTNYFQCRTATITASQEIYRIKYKFTEENSYYSIQSAVTCTILNNANVPFSMAILSKYTYSGSMWLILPGYYSEYSYMYDTSPGDLDLYNGA